MAQEKTVTPLSLNDLKVEVVSGTGKASGKPYTALRFIVDVDGTPYASMIFINKVKE